MQQEARGFEILVVEDHAEVAEALVLLLEEQGYDVRAASNGAEAIEMLRTHRPRVVFVDLVMPVLNGLELIDAMRKDDELAKIPVIAMTASEVAPEGVPTMKKPFAIPGLLGAARFYCAAGGARRRRAGAEA
jgi:CheY-like chemotaxis protein